MSEPGERDRLAVMVHELKSPVAALGAIHEALGGNPRERDDPVQHIRLALAAAAAIERLVRDASPASVARVPVDVRRLLEDAAASARLRGGRVRVEAVDTPPIQADPVRIRQAVDNLVANALAQTADEDEVVLRAGIENDDVVLSVADAGPGIAEADQQRMFERGERLQAPYPGSGLGLGIVKAIAEAHGGRVAVRSAPGEGATFSLLLPLGPTKDPR